MGIEDIPSFTHLKQTLDSLNLLLSTGLVPSGRKRAEIKKQLEATRAQMHHLADFLERFNRYFSKEGWLAYGRLDFGVVERAVSEYERAGMEAATEVIQGHFSPESVGQRLVFFDGLEELRVRRRLIAFAFEDYEARRYHAVVPILLMVIDGAVNDAVGKGFHAETLNLDVWDSITAADGAINDIKSIFQRSRRKTRTEPIRLPYRNGILHGMDLGYDNEIVSAKCWCFLFVIADWIADKKSEEQRRERLAEEARVPSLLKIAERLDENRRMQEAIQSWSPRKMTAEQIVELNQDRVSVPGTPEEVVLRLLDLWAAKNYGGMAKHYWALAEPESGRHAGCVRECLGEVLVGSYVIDRVDDQAPAISQIDVTLNETSPHPLRYAFRLVFEDASGNSLPRGYAGGSWRVVWVQPADRGESG
jgi:hypothetical protein